MSDASKDRIEGKVDEAVGRGKAAAGELTGNPELRDEGRADQAAGQVKQGIAEVKDRIDGFVKRITGDKKERER